MNKADNDASTRAIDSLLNYEVHSFGLFDLFSLILILVSVQCITQFCLTCFFFLMPDCEIFQQ